ncbi:MAG: leucyl/phenylalanyl-tRNA--protein transferase [Bacteroidales bacterium]|nr:leucyl/phenylalanyl-tRNA--protein transferase [Bacteroidales bacterium]
MAREIIFPNPNDAEDDGLIAVGGNLSEEFLLAAYSQGIFPWYNEGEPVLWWSPNPRMVLFPQKFKCSKSFKQFFNSKRFEIRIDFNFKEVIKNCSKVKRTGQIGTWITKDVIKAYIKLHELGYAHSIETYEGENLVGGLYGVSLGKAFFGESMFYKVNNASKIALFYLNKLMLNWDYHFIDVQQSTSHLRSMGAEDIERAKFLKILNEALKFPTKKGRWSMNY